MYVKSEHEMFMDNLEPIDKPLVPHCGWHCLDRVYKPYVSGAEWRRHGGSPASWTSPELCWTGLERSESEPAQSSLNRPRAVWVWISPEQSEPAYSGLSLNQPRAVWVWTSPERSELAKSGLSLKQPRVVWTSPERSELAQSGLNQP